MPAKSEFESIAMGLVETRGDYRPCLADLVVCTRCFIFCARYGVQEFLASNTPYSVLGPGGPDIECFVCILNYVP